MFLYLCNRNPLAGLLNYFFWKFLLFLQYVGTIESKLDFKHVNAFSNLNAYFILSDKETVHLYYEGFPFWLKWKLTIHIFMVAHRSTSFPECVPTEYLALEPCYFYFIQVFFRLYFHMKFKSTSCCKPWQDYLSTDNSPMVRFFLWVNSPVTAANIVIYAILLLH